MNALAILALFGIVGVLLSVWMYHEANEGAHPFLAIIVYVAWTVGAIAATVFGIFFC